MGLFKDMFSTPPDEAFANGIARLAEGKTVKASYWFGEAEGDFLKNEKEGKPGSLACYLATGFAGVGGFSVGPATVRLIQSLISEISGVDLEEVRRECRAEEHLSDARFQYANGLLYAFADEFGGVPDYVKAAECFQRSVEARGAYTLHSKLQLARLAAEGFGQPRDAALAERLLKEACAKPGSYFAECLSRGTEVLISPRGRSWKPRGA
jgi:hypothetical protein